MDDWFEPNFAEQTDFIWFDDTIQIGDAVYLGKLYSQFKGLKTNVTNDLYSMLDISWQYWNGANWIVVNPNANEDALVETGNQNVLWTVPGAWSKETFNDTYAYWIRGIVADFTLLNSRTWTMQTFHNYSDWVVTTSGSDTTVVITDDRLHLKAGEGFNDAKLELDVGTFP